MWSYQIVVDVSGCGRILELLMFLDCGRIRDLSMFLVVVVSESCRCFMMWSYHRVVDVSRCGRIIELLMFLDVVVSESCLCFRTSLPSIRLRLCQHSS